MSGLLDVVSRKVILTFPHPLIPGPFDSVDNSLAKSIPNAQIVVYKYHSHLKKKQQTNKTHLLGEWLIKGKQWEIYKEPGKALSGSKAVIKNHWSPIKKTQSFGDLKAQF